MTFEAAVSMFSVSMLSGDLASEPNSRSCSFRSWIRCFLRILIDCWKFI